jgi:hypothetical protein
MRTQAKLIRDVDQLLEGEKGYIDGYSRGADGRCYALFVRMEDHSIHTIYIGDIMALGLIQ